MTDGVFAEVLNFPDADAKERYNELVGLDNIKQRLEKEAAILIRPDLLDKWSTDFHRGKHEALSLLKRRTPLFVFAGDVGTGKTELGLTCADQLARTIKLPIELFQLTLTIRGTGAVGEMTNLISQGFKHVKARTARLRKDRKITGATLLLIDEADSLAQSRELGQMHHEDRAGVNALIHGVDDIARAKLPCITIMCTNRVSALDPAIRRRAAAVFEFKRPTLSQREQLLSKYLKDFGLNDNQISELAHMTGETDTRSYGYTFSDITQRYIPSVVLAAYPNKSIDAALARELVDATPPTPPFSTKE